MSFTIQVINPDEEFWNNNLKKSDVATAYQIYGWGKLYQKSYDSKPIFIVVLDSNNNVVGQLLSFIHTKYFWANANPIVSSIGEKFNLGSTLTWWYGPIIHNKHHQNEILDLILKKLDEISNQYNIVMIRGSSPPNYDLFPKNPFLKHGYSLSTWGTHIVELAKNTETIFNNLNKKIRYDIKKSYEKNLTFLVGDSRKDLDDYAMLKSDFKKRTGITAKKNSTFHDSHWKYLQKMNNEKLFLVKHNDIPISAILGVAFNGKIIQHGVVNSSKTDLYSGSFLTWNAIKWSAENGYDTFDMGGINPNPNTAKEKSIDFYKSKWANKQIHYNIFTKIMNKTKFNFASFLINPSKLTKKFLK